MPTNAIDNNTKPTYTLTANNGDNPRITYEQTGIPECHIHELCETVQCSFREVQVTCDQTGELIFQVYVSTEFFEPIFSMSHTLETLDAINQR